MELSGLPPSASMFDEALDLMNEKDLSSRFTKLLDDDVGTRLGNEALRLER